MLNQALKVLNNPLPSDILYWLNSQWRAPTKNNNKQLPDDSMEIAILKLHLDTLYLEYSLANMRFVVISANDKIQIFENQECSIGETNSLEKPDVFITQNVYLAKGDTIYLFTDGFFDQYGKNNQKLMFKQFLEHLKTLSKHSITEQKNITEEFFNTWKGQKKQTDDVLIIAINI